METLRVEGPDADELCWKIRIVLETPKILPGHPTSRRKNKLQLESYGRTITLRFYQQTKVRPQLY